MKNSTERRGDERAHDDGGGGSAPHDSSITLVASQNGMTSRPSNVQNSRQARANHQITDVGSKNNGGGGGNNAPTTTGGVSTRSKGGSASADPSAGGTKAAAAKKRSAKTLNDEDTEDDAPTASTTASSSRTKTKTNKRTKKSGKAGGASASAPVASTRASTKKRSSSSKTAAASANKTRRTSASSTSAGRGDEGGGKAAAVVAAGANGDSNGASQGGRPRRSVANKAASGLIELLRNEQLGDKAFFGDDDEESEEDEEEDWTEKTAKGRGGKVSTTAKPAAKSKTTKPAAKSTKATKSTDALLTSTTGAPNSPSSFMSDMTFARGGVCFNKDCDDDDCNDNCATPALDDYGQFPVGTLVSVLFEGQEEPCIGTVIHQPVYDDDYRIEHEDGYVDSASQEEVEENAIPISDDATKMYAIDTMVEREFELAGGEEGVVSFAAVVTVPCKGGCGGACGHDDEEDACQGRLYYIVEHEDGYLETIHPSVMSQYAVGGGAGSEGEPVGTYRAAAPPTPDTALSMLFGDDYSNAGDVEECPQPSDLSSLGDGDIKKISQQLKSATINCVDPTAAGASHPGLCKCGAMAMTLVKVPNKGPGKHQPTHCWPCAQESDVPTEQYIQSPAICGCCAERYKCFQNCRDCVENFRFCRICEKEGCYDTNRYCKSCIDNGDVGKGKKCQNFSQCGEIGTYKNFLLCKKCRAARRATVPACSRCRKQKTSPGYVSVASSNVCAECHNDGQPFCKAWIGRGELCSNVARVRSRKGGVLRYAPLCNSHNRKCGTVKGENRKDTRYIARDNQGKINEDWLPQN